MDLICFSHLRWNFVYQRPQHLLSRFARSNRVFYVEEPEFDSESDHLKLITTKENVRLVTPRLSGDPSQGDVVERQRKLIDDLLFNEKIGDYALWYYTPMAMPICGHLRPRLIVYDCMDELSAFKFAPPQLKELEQQLFERADVVFTGGYSLYQAKKNNHANVHLFPSSIDKDHFAKARRRTADPQDQSSIPHPRFGFYGVIDERFDVDLIKKVAQEKPDWHFIIIGPVVKIDPATLPQSPNVHFMGGRPYDSLPDYLSGWDIAIIPFLLNESTRYISPTKTPEYLAAGKPVISTAIQDVENPYGVQNLVHIAKNANHFIALAENKLADVDQQQWLSKVDAFIANDSWDLTWKHMAGSMNEALGQSIF